MIYPDIFRNEPSKRTPWIVLEHGAIFIMGRSIPEDPGEFYRPIYEWISRYSRDNQNITKIDIGFEYINTSSTKWIFNILKELSEMNNLAKNTRITWYYERTDEDMCELGFILRSLVECPFVFVEVNLMNNEKYKKILSEA